jgi:hypothetical protein
VFAAARLQLIVCAVFGALLLAGCGGGEEDTTQDLTISSRPDGATVEKPSPKSDRRKDAKRPAPGGALCQSQLAVGVTYDQYVAEVRGIRSTYGEIPTGKLQIDCLTLVAAPSEKAFNRYIEGANDWGECVSRLGCGTETIEPVLQRRWRIASHFLSEAQDGLGAAG